MDWHALEKKKVSELRDMAKEKTSLQGVSGLSKEQLVEELAKVLGIARPHKVAEGQQKSKIKQRIHELKAQRDDVLRQADHSRLTILHHELHRLKRQLRKQAHLSS